MTDMAGPKGVSNVSDLVWTPGQLTDLLVAGMQSECGFIHEKASSNVVNEWSKRWKPGK